MNPGLGLAPSWVAQHWNPLSSVTKPPDVESSHDDSPPLEKADDELETRDFERCRCSRRVALADLPSVSEDVREAGAAKGVCADLRLKP